MQPRYFVEMPVNPCLGRLLLVPYCTVLHYRVYTVLARSASSDLLAALGTPVG